MKSGFVAILGRPNVGKSTLLNAILNKKVSIVTDKAQTTRDDIKGIFNSEDAQIVFIDTPGIHKPHQKLGQEMNNMAFGAAHNVDASILVIDSSKSFGDGDRYLLDHLDINNAPLIIVLNKIDLVKITEAQKLRSIYEEKFPNATILECVAKEKFNVDTLISRLIEILPEGPRYYDVAEVSDKDEIFQIKEIIREKILKTLRDEVPHSIAIYMENIEWEENPIEIKASIIVEKDSQKGIVIGAGGRRIRDIGTKARRDIEKLLNKHVFLELFVKVSEDWRNQEDALSKFGYKYEK
ncbi:MAG: GTPase Era [Bacilli bacterium]|nr:GTPase Era [Bacilli bacterium]